MAHHRPPPLPFLPATCTFTNGVTAIIRAITTEEEIDHYTNMVLPYMGKDDGYSFDEYPTFEAFKYCQLISNYSMIAEDADTHDIIAFFSLGPFWLHRGEAKAAHESAVLIYPKYRSRNIGLELGRLAFAMGKQLGYKYHIGETAITNAVSRHIHPKVGFQCCGVIPRCMYMDGRGWVDGTIAVMETDKLPETFTQMIDRLNTAKSSAKL